MPSQLRISNILCNQASVRGAWDGWRLDQSRIFVFENLKDGLGAALGASGLGVCVFGSRHSLAAFAAAVTELEVDTGAGPPPPEPGRCAARLSSCNEPFVEACGAVVLLLDPALDTLKAMSGRVSQLVQKRPVVLVCPWWPGGNFYEFALAASFGARPVTVLGESPFLVPLAGVTRVHHTLPACGMCARLIENKRSPADTLAACRRLCVHVGLLKASLQDRTLLILDTVSARKAVAELCEVGHTVACDKATVLQGSLFLDASRAWHVVFVVQCLIEYEERLILYALAEAGIPVCGITSHTWTRDGDAARVEGWAPGIDESAASAALVALVG